MRCRCCVLCVTAAALVLGILIAVHGLHTAMQAAAKAAPTASGGYLRGLIDIIIGNLQLSVKNIHIRYEAR